MYVALGQLKLEFWNGVHVELSSRPLSKLEVMLLLCIINASVSLIVGTQQTRIDCWNRMT